MEAELSIVVRALFMPMLGLVVVGSLCHAMIPRSGREVSKGSIRTPSVFVPPTSMPTRRRRDDVVELMADASLIVRGPSFDISTSELYVSSFGRNTQATEMLGCTV